MRIRSRHHRPYALKTASCMLRQLSASRSYFVHRRGEILGGLLLADANRAVVVLCVEAIEEIELHTFALRIVQLVLIILPAACAFARWTRVDATALAFDRLAQKHLRALTGSAIVVLVACCGMALVLAMLQSADVVPEDTICATVVPVGRTCMPLREVSRSIAVACGGMGETAQGGGGELALVSNIACDDGVPGGGKIEHATLKAHTSRSLGNLTDIHIQFIPCCSVCREARLRVVSVVCAIVDEVVDERDVLTCTRPRIVKSVCHCCASLPVMAIPSGDDDEATLVVEEIR